MQDIDLKTLLESGAHFGHKTNKWNPASHKFIYKAIGDIHIIDLTLTKEYLEKARKAVFDMAARGKKVLFVGTKRQAASLVKQEAETVHAPYITSRWVGGFITNWQEVKKNIDKMLKLESDLKDKAKMSMFTKREQVHMDKYRQNLALMYNGVRDLETIPAMVYVIDIKKEITAVRESTQNNIPVVGIVDTNSSPAAIQYPIPANDDAVGSISYITKLIAEAYAEGKEKYQKTVAANEKAEKDSIAKEQKNKTEEIKKSNQKETN